MILFEWCESNSVIIKVKCGIVVSHEGISQNPKWSSWWRNIHSHKCRDTLSLTLIFDYQNIVFEQSLKFKVNCGKFRFLVKLKILVKMKSFVIKMPFLLQIEIPMKGIFLLKIETLIKFRHKIDFLVKALLEINFGQ